MRAFTFVQARMSSNRFPGKVLAPFRGRPLIQWVIERAQRALPDSPPVLVTSVHPSDDPLAGYVASLGFPVHRGPLDDVFGRFASALASHPCERVVRICADSPLLSGEVLQKTFAEARGDWDLVTTTAPRSFPKGHNVEIIRSALFTELRDELDADDREHVTRFFHRHPDRFRIRNVSSGDPRLAETNYAVDTIDDLKRLEALNLDPA